MLFWILIALLTATAVVAVLAPLGRAARKADAGEAQRVYADQLGELKRDLEYGRIEAGEAEAARAEIARRLIASDNGAPAVAAAGNPTARKATALVALVAIPAVSAGLYLALGAPGLPGRPLAARLADPAAADIGVLVVRAEDHLAKNPQDGRGWDVLAPVYLQLGRTEDAAAAYRSAIRLNGSSAARQTGLGQAVVTAEGGIVTAEARAAFEAAKAADPEAPGPRFFLALAAEQEGRAADAAEGWRKLLADTPADAPWRAAVEQALARVEPGEAPSGPTAEQVAAAQEMTAEDRASMISGMVEGLAARLREEPDDVEGWLRLIRSYTVLGRTGDANEAASAALSGLSAPADRARVEEMIAELGLAPAEAVAQ